MSYSTTLSYYDVWSLLCRTLKGIKGDIQNRKKKIVHQGSSRIRDVTSCPDLNETVDDPVFNEVKRTVNNFTYVQSHKPIRCLFRIWIQKFKKREPKMNRKFFFLLFCEYSIDVKWVVFVPYSAITTTFRILFTY